MMEMERLLQQVLQLAIHYYETATSEQIITLVIAFLLLFTLVLLMAYVAYNTIRWVCRIIRRKFCQITKGFAMRKREKGKEEFRRQLADIYTEALENAVDKKLITEDEARREYRKLSRTLGLWDCAQGRFALPSPHPEDLKKAITERLTHAKKQPEKMNGVTLIYNT